MAYGPKQRQSVSASLRHTANGKGRQSRRRRGNCISVYTPLKHTFVCLAARAGGRPFQLISAYNGAICKSADFLSYPGRRVAAPRWGAVFAAAGQDTVRGKKLRRYTPGRRRALSYALPDLQRLRCLRIRKNCSADPYTKLSRADKGHAPAQHTQALPGAIARRRPCKSVKMLAISRQMLYTQEYLDRGVVGTLRVILPTYWLAAWLLI